MPGIRPVRKGSFAGHLDELLKHFIHEPPPSKRSAKKPHPAKRKPKRGSVHQALLERAAH